MASTVGLLEDYPGFAVHVSASSRIGVGMTSAAAPEFYQPHCIYMACGRGGYVGAVRLENGELDVAAALTPAFVRDAGGPTAIVHSLLSQVGWPRWDLIPTKTTTWKGTARLTRRCRPVAREGIFLLGDAAGYVEPFTGEGIAWALGEAEAIADTALEAVRRWRPSLAAQWNRYYQRHLAWRQMRCRAVAALLRRPRLMRPAVKAARGLPWVARPVARAMTAPMPARSIHRSTGGGTHGVHTAWAGHSPSHRHH